MGAVSIKISWSAPPSTGAVAIDPATAVRDILSVRDADLDYARAKLALDELIDPAIDSTATMVMIDRLVAVVRESAGLSSSQGAMLKALRTTVYDPGPWNGGVRSPTITTIRSGNALPTNCWRIT